MNSWGGAMHKLCAGIAAVAALTVFAASVPSVAADLDDFEERGYFDYRRSLVPETFAVHRRPLVRETVVVEREPIIQQPTIRETVIVDRRPIVRRTVVVDRRPIVRRTVVVDRRPVVHKTVIVEPRRGFRRPYGLAGLWRD
jgi:hypothetical protein